MYMSRDQKIVARYVGGPMDGAIRQMPRGEQSYKVVANPFMSGEPTKYRLVYVRDTYFYLWEPANLVPECVEATEYITLNSMMHNTRSEIEMRVMAKTLDVELALKGKGYKLYTPITIRAGFSARFAHGCDMFYITASAFTFVPQDSQGL